MYKWIMSILFFGACALGLIFLLVIAQPEKGQEEAAPEDGKPRLTITASNFQFDQAEYRVKKGDTMEIALKNKEGVHGVDIAQLGILLSGKDLTKEVTFDKAGTYDIVCAIPCGAGHVDMKAKLIVE